MPTSYYIKVGNRHLHRIVAEQKIGRPLRPGEVVHHINGDALDNRPENLEVLPSQAEHARLHFTKNRKCVLPGCGRKRKCWRLCNAHSQQWRTASERGWHHADCARCAAPGCGKPHHGHGLCQRHLLQLKKNVGGVMP